MSDQFVGEIRVFGFNFAPTGWAQCAGQLMPISQNTALFSLLGTWYGGDGKSTFALPNFQDRGGIQQGQGAGLSNYDLGQEDGVETVTLIDAEMPLHTHTQQARATAGDLQAPAPTRGFARSVGGTIYQSNTTQNLTFMAPQTLTVAGASLPHNNWPPVLVLNFCIALQGIFPPRS
jgi:microcystin-dependent protein